MIESLESIIHAYESTIVVRKYKLTRDEFNYLHLTAEGCEHPELMDYFNCQKDKLYRLRISIIRKMKARNLNQALVIYTRTTVPGCK